MQAKLKKILIHLGLIILSAVLLIFITLSVLRSYTKHNDPLIEVPDLEGKSSKSAIAELEKLGLGYEIMDTVYKDGMRKLAVINQNPASGQSVKKGRTIYLVINSNDIPMVEVPELAGKTSLNQAKSILSRLGLKVGEIIERPSEMVKSKANQPVLGQRLHGEEKELTPGGFIERNSIIDLVVGVPIESSDSTNLMMDEPEDDSPLELF